MLVFVYLVLINPSELSHDDFFRGNLMVKLAVTLHGSTNQVRTLFYSHTLHLH